MSPSPLVLLERETALETLPAVASTSAETSITMYGIVALIA